MRVMVLVKATESSEKGFSLPSEWSTEKMAAMGRFNDELRDAGVPLAAAGLQPPSHGRRVAFDGVERSARHGSFPQPRELVAGYWL